MDARTDRPVTPAAAADQIPLSDDLTLPGLFIARARRTPERIAYRQFDAEAGRWRGYSWAQTLRDAARWRAMLAKMNLKAGARVAIMCANRREWALFDFAAMSLGLVVTPLYFNDSGDNATWILRHSGARLLVIEGQEQWDEMIDHMPDLPGVARVLSIEPVVHDDEEIAAPEHVARLLPPVAVDFTAIALDPDAMATLVYTSGTTGRPKGVMLSHRNILTNAAAGLAVVPGREGDVLLSFLPLSHMLERMAGYYLPVMAGMEVAYARSVSMLAEDFLAVRPTLFFSVPRIFERIQERINERLEEAGAFRRWLFHLAVRIGMRRFEVRQGRARWSPALLAWPLLDRLVARKIRAGLGGRVRVAITGGAALPANVACTFIGLGVNIVQGYGLTEASPLISVNAPEDNYPASVGEPVPGVEVRLGAGGELLCRGPNVMLGYWRNEEATKEIIDDDGWLHSGDMARIENGHIYITGRLKEIIVLSTGEKIPPADMEMKIMEDPVIEQVFVHGEGRPFPAALVRLRKTRWEALLAREGVARLPDEKKREEAAEALLLERIAARLVDFPAWAAVRRAMIVDDDWDISSGLMTPTLKLRRRALVKRYGQRIAALYEDR